MRTTLVLVALALALGAGAWVRASTPSSQLTLLGQDVQRRAFSTIFTVELWAERSVLRYDQEVRLDIRFNTAVDGADIAEFLAEEAQEIHELSAEEATLLERRLAGALGCDFTSGSSLQIHFRPQDGVQLRCNGARESKLELGSMSFYLLDVFLHPNTEYSGLVAHRENE